MNDTVSKLAKQFSEITAQVRALEAHLELFRREGAAVEADLLTAKMQRDDLRGRLDAAIAAEAETAKAAAEAAAGKVKVEAASKAGKKP